MEKTSETAVKLINAILEVCKEAYGVFNVASLASDAHVSKYAARKFINEAIAGSELFCDRVITRFEKGQFTLEPLKAKSKKRRAPAKELNQATITETNLSAYRSGFVAGVVAAMQNIAEFPPERFEGTRFPS